MSGNDSGNVPAGTPQRQRLSHLQPPLRALSQSTQSRPQDVTPGPSTTRPPNPSFRTLLFSFFVTSLIVCVSYWRKRRIKEKKKRRLPYLIPTHTTFFLPQSLVAIARAVYGTTPSLRGDAGTGIYLPKSKGGFYLIRCSSPFV
ncbi:hypothetical protein HDV63DRAFT_119779 [Trichoderma sp. SZMC 28014]